VEAAVEIKLREGLAARIPERIAEVLERTAAEAKSCSADPGLVRAVWSEMIEWFVTYEERKLEERSRL
jgi:isochorismate pyruvate lyase